MCAYQMHELVRNDVKRLDRRLNVRDHLYDLDTEKKPIIFDIAVDK